MSATLASGSLSTTVIQKPVGRYRHSELKDAAPRRIWRCPQTAAMRFHNRAADRQPHSHSFGLSREKGIEDVVRLRRVEPHTRIRYRDQYITRPSHLRAYAQHPRTMHARGHRLDPVYDQIQNDLLHLATVAQAAPGCTPVITTPLPPIFEQVPDRRSYGPA